VFTEWSAYEVSAQRYQQLAPLMLLQRVDATGTDTSATLTLTADSHPIWTGLPQSFTTPTVVYSTGTAINGGVQIAGLSGDTSIAPGPGVLARESQGTAGHVVHIAHAAAYNPGWESDANALLMFTNALRWATHCL
jgi:hypothetical protein